MPGRRSMARRRKPHCGEQPEPEEVQGRAPVQSGGALDEEERMLLRGEAREAFLGALIDPPKPTDKLRAMLGRHREVCGGTPRRLPRPGRP